MTRAIQTLQPRISVAPMMDWTNSQILTNNINNLKYK